MLVESLTQRAMRIFPHCVSTQPSRQALNIAPAVLLMLAGSQVKPLWIDSTNIAHAKFSQTRRDNVAYDDACNEHCSQMTHEG